MVEPGEATDFVAITDAVNVVVKMPSTMGDKYIGELPGDRPELTRSRESP
jgi:hypothetical protein